MVVSFVAASLPTPSQEEQADRAAWVALEAIGALTRMANDARDSEYAYRLHERANEITAAALGAVGVALDRAERLTN